MAGFSYDENAPNGPRNWGRINPNCDGKRQSPVNFVWFNATVVLTGPRVTIQNIARRPESIRYENNGHGVSISLNYTNGNQPRFLGGPLGRDSFIFSSMHMHWRSEHTVGSRMLDAELHLVSYNSKYGSLAQALEYPDGLAVLGFLYEMPPHANNTVFDVVRPFFNGTSYVREPGANYVERRNLFSLLEVIGTAAFTIWNYNGSLTTPSKIQTSI